MRFSAIVGLVCFLGCSSAVPVATPLPVEPNSSGATVYVVETWEDWLDDGRDLANSFEGPTQTQWLGEQALGIALRSASVGSKARITFQKRLEFREGQPLHLFVPEVVHYVTATREGTFELRESSKAAGLEFAATPRLNAQGNFVSLACSLTRTCPIRAKIPGTEFEAGTPSFSNLLIDSGTRTIPLGASLLLQLPRGDGRCTVFLFHVASVTPEPQCTFPKCIERLIENPTDRWARCQFPALLKASDDETMATMRAHHGTGKTQMLHNYPSHQWIQPFLRGCQLIRDGKFNEAEFEFEAARAAANEHLSSGLTRVIAHESALRLEELSQRNK